MSLTKLELLQADAQRLELIAAIAPLLEERQSLSTMIAEFTKRKDELSADIGNQMVREGLLKLDVELADGTVYGATYNPACERSTLNELKLVENGVGTDVIAKSKTTSTFAKLDVREKKAKS
jgi:hypothetical protein